VGFTGDIHMNGSYIQHSKDTEEYENGQSAALIDSAMVMGKPFTNPHPASSKDWLDWQLGYESVARENAERSEIRRLREAELDALKSSYSLRFDPFAYNGV
jgi:hypothetical protein